MIKLLILNLLWQLQAAPDTTGLGAPDSLTPTSRKELVAEMAGIIRDRSCFNDGFLQNYYDAWADTTKGLELYVANIVEEDPWAINRRYPFRSNKIDWKANWSVIDFSQPVRAADLRVRFHTDDGTFFTLKAAKTICRRVKNGKNRQLELSFFSNGKRRPANCGQLQTRLIAIIRQLTEP